PGCRCRRTTRASSPDALTSDRQGPLRHRRTSLLQEDALRVPVPLVRLLGAVADGGEADPAVLGEAADHVEDDADLAGLVEVQAVPGHDVEQVAGHQPAQV